MRLGRNATIATLVLSTALITVLVTVLTAGGGREAPPEEVGLSIPSVPEGRLPAPELLLPRENERLLSHRFRPYREPRGVWSESDKERFWTDPRTVTEEYLMVEGKKAVESMLEAIP
ncbi:MAG: hypothetical protein ACLFPV_01200 [Spirochaetaceae bacterium]